MTLNSGENSHPDYYLGVDTGGTFTDFVLWHNGRIRIHKVLSTPRAPEQAILSGVHELGLLELPDDANLYIVHGSTVATNAILERKGVRCVLITNHGFADMLTIGRQSRRELYNLQPQPDPAPVPAQYCLETGGRIGADGEVLEPLTEAQLQALRRQITDLKPQAVAINLLFSYLDDHFERRIEDAMPKEVFVSRSSFILPEYGEFERGMTTWLNAYIGPLVKDYLQRLVQGVPQAAISVMQSSGGTMAIEQAADQAVHMVLSGPAGGLAAARHLGELTDTPRLLTFDMGGTSTDVALIDGQLILTSEGEIGGYPVAIPMVDMHTIGAGGGSIARIDEGGLLQVGPESAGALPGPACYGGGGEFATVTDANLVLGRLRAEAFLGGGMQLDVEAARQVVAGLARQLDLSVEDCAQGVIDIANEHMAQALRVMSVQRGVDARELTLMSFGGAGGLHVCALADALEIERAIVPVHAGVLSALGMLVAPRSRQFSHTLNRLLQDCELDMVQSCFEPLCEQGKVALMDEGVRVEDIHIDYSLDLRYHGQSYYLNVAWTDLTQSAEAFHQLHQARYGHRLDAPLELVNVRVGLSSSVAPPDLVRSDASVATGSAQADVWAPLVGITEPVAVLDRQRLMEGEEILGPALITESISTTYLAPGWSAMTDRFGNLRLQRSSRRVE